MSSLHCGWKIAIPVGMTSVLVNAVLGMVGMPAG
jgi:NADH:ubiquinone oxidoreductase subunit H